MLTQKGKRKASQLKTSQVRLENFFHYVIGIPKDSSNKISKIFSHYLDTKTRKRFIEFYRIMIDFKPENSADLVEFIKQSRKEVKVNEIPADVIKITDDNYPEEEEEM